MEHEVLVFYHIPRTGFGQKAEGEFGTACISLRPPLKLFVIYPVAGFRDTAVTEAEKFDGVWHEPVVDTIDVNHLTLQCGTKYQPADLVTDVVTCGC